MNGPPFSFLLVLLLLMCVRVHLCAHVTCCLPSSRVRHSLPAVASGVPHQLSAIFLCGAQSPGCGFWSAHELCEARFPGCGFWGAPSPPVSLSRTSTLTAMWVQRVAVQIIGCFAYWAIHSWSPSPLASCLLPSLCFLGQLSSFVTGHEARQTR